MVSSPAVRTTSILGSVIVGCAVGLEAQTSWADLDRQPSVPNNQTFGIIGFRTDANIIGSLAGRGSAMRSAQQARRSIFVKGGAAFINEKFYAHWAS